MKTLEDKKTYSYEDALKKSVEYFNNDELAASVFIGKYALRNKDEDILEPTPDYMHERLAKEFARIEKKYPNPLSKEEILSFIKNFKYIIAQGSPMSAIGNPYKYMSAGNCFKKDTKILTTNGVKKIIDVKVGDKVVTHTGIIREVTQTHKNPIKDRKVFNIKCLKTPNIEVTENHKFLSISKEQIEWGVEPTWNSISYLRKGDYIAIPNRFDDDSIENYDIDLVDLFDNEFSVYNKKYTLEIKENVIYLKTHRKNKTKISFSNHKPVHRKWRIDNDFAYFLGLWYGDGCVFDENSNGVNGGVRNRKNNKDNRVRGITFTFGSHETKLINFVSEYGSKLFGIDPDINDNNHIDGSCQVVFHGSIIGILFEKLFGRKSQGKRLYKDIFIWSKEMYYHLLKGLVDSDGCFTKTGDLRVVLCNKSLIEEFYHLGRSHGQVLGISIGEKYARLDFPKGFNIIDISRKRYNDDRVEKFIQREEYEGSILQINNNKFVRITDKLEVKNPDKFYYTLGIDTDHSYSVEGLICENCFVIDSPYDSYSGITYTDQQQANLMKRRAGVGFDASPIRPAGMVVNNAAKTTDGIGLFLERFSNTTREVAQNGRRGALLISLSIHHPDIRTFINIKKDLKKVTGANISIRLTDEFMNAVEADQDYELRWPVDSREKGEEPQLSKFVSAKEIWEEIIEAAWTSAEPGLMYWDTMNRFSPSHCYGKVDESFFNRSTNPCGEIVMGRDSCRLMCLNLFSFAINPFEEKSFIDYDKLAEMAFIAQRLMDDLVDLEIELIERIIDKVKKDPEPDHIKKLEIDMWKDFLKNCKNGRRTGLGVTGLGDTLAAVGIRYGSEESIEVTEKIYKTICLSAYKSSCKLAEERGCFPLYDFDIEDGNEFIERIFEADPELKDLHKKNGRRNIALLTTAPTGSVSIMTQTTSGIEPAFMLKYKRRKKINPNDENVRTDFVDQNGDHWQEFVVYHHNFKKWMDVSGKEEIKDSPYYKGTSNDIDWSQSVNLQASAQKWIDHSISKTCNIPKDTPKEVVADIYMKAWHKQCKGFTVYRDGCRSGVLVEDKKERDSSDLDQLKIDDFLKKTQAPKRPLSLPCDVFHLTSKCQRFYVVVGLLEGHPYEVFTGINHDNNGEIVIPKRVTEGNIEKIKRGTYELVHYNQNGEEERYKLTNGHNDDMADAMTRLISVALRHGADISFIVHQLEKTKGDLMSFSKVVARTIKKYIKEGTKVSGVSCDKCGSESIIRQEGCLICQECGNGKCG